MMADSQLDMMRKSPEEIAFKMLYLIADAEGRSLYSHGDRAVSRKWILTTYAQCHAAVVQGWSYPTIAENRPLVE